ncbi:AAA family ATPase [Larkinella sp. GY13]|uniref:AAA family ATPase n=1 Tax=Larkinella sp. GY13 TaxID=3453720 RepID=UPI003EEBA8C4
MITYRGTALDRSVEITRSDGKTDTLHPYLPDAGLRKAVNLALMLQRPLLLMGEPGCGKSLLAKALAYELYGTDFANYYREWNIKSTSKAQEGLYEYDHIRRLADAQIARTDADREQLLKTNYIRLGPMGQAFANSQQADRPFVLLIDEIDKADIDFSNDLLNELDKGEFTVTETGQQIRASVRPIVIITSNGERDLSDAFLRRCLFHHIAAFDRERLAQIVKYRFYSNAPVEVPLIDKAVAVYLAIRTYMAANKFSTGKNVSTAEFLDWYRVLDFYDGMQPTGDPVLDELIAERNELGGALRDVPFPQVLLKHLNSLTKFQEAT